MKTIVIVISYNMCTFICIRFENLSNLFIKIYVNITVPTHTQNNFKLLKRLKILKLTSNTSYTK